MKATDFKGKPTLVDTEHVSVVSGWYPDPAGMSQLRFWDGQSWTTATASPPVMQQPSPVLQAPLVVQAPPVSDDPTASHVPWPPKGPGRSSRFYAVIAGVALGALVGAVVVELATETHHDSSAVPNAVSPAQHNAKYDTSTRTDIKNAAIAEETYFTDNDTYTTSGAGAAGSNTGPLRGYTRSDGSVSITFSLFGTQSYMIVAVSKSGRSFCFNSLRSGAGVVVGNAC